MPVENIGDVLQASLAYQRARIEASAYNVSQANVAVRTGETPTAQSATPDAAFARRIGIETPATAETKDVTGGSTDLRLVLEPGNPAADENGIVRYPAVDLAGEMTTMMSASRAYEATVRSYNILKSMNAKAMEIGK